MHSVCVLHKKICCSAVASKHKSRFFLNWLFYNCRPKCYKHCYWQHVSLLSSGLSKVLITLSDSLSLSFLSLFIFKLWKEAKTQEENHLMEDKKKKKQEEKKKKEAAQKKVSPLFDFILKNTTSYLLVLIVFIPQLESNWEAESLEFSGRSCLSIVVPLPFSSASLVQSCL